MVPSKRALTLVLALTILSNVADFFGTFGFLWMILKSKLSNGSELLTRIGVEELTTL